MTGIKSNDFVTQATRNSLTVYSINNFLSFKITKKDSKNINKKHCQTLICFQAENVNSSFLVDF